MDMISPSIYNPHISELKTFRKPYDSMIEEAAEIIKDSIKNNSIFYLDINHGDGDALSITILAHLLDVVGMRYYLMPYNGTHHLTFASSIWPSKSIEDKIKKDNYVTFITSDNTPWPVFWKQVKKFYSKLDSKEKEKLKIIDIDHHAFVEREKISLLKKFEEDDIQTTPTTFYINAGLSRDVLDAWYKDQSVPCAGEIIFDISKQLIKELYPEKEDDFVKKAVIPLLIATETDMRTSEALDRYSEDRKVYSAIKDVQRWKLYDKYKGEITIPSRFVNIANGALRISGAMIDKPYYDLMDERIISNYPTHKVLYDLARSIYFASQSKNPKALIADPRELGLGNHSPLKNILSLDSEHSKIKSKVRGSFLEWDYNSYKLRDDASLKSEKTNILITMIYGKNRVISLKGRKIDISNLLKVPPYMTFFLTQYPPISESPLVSSSSFVVAVVEGQPYEPNSPVHISLRIPSGKSHSYPLGMIAEGVSAFIKREYNVPSSDVQGGGHPKAAAIRMKQYILNEIMKRERLDKFETIDWIIENSLSYAFR